MSLPELINKGKTKKTTPEGVAFYLVVKEGLEPSTPRFISLVKPLFHAE